MVGTVFIVLFVLFVLAAPAALFLFGPAGFMAHGILRQRLLAIKTWTDREAAR